MLRRRKVRQSLRDAVAYLLANPPTATGLTGFNIYTEDQMRNSAFVPTEPYVYMIDSKVSLAQIQLPLIVIFSLNRGAQLELGNRTGALIYDISISVNTESRGKSEDLADLIATYLLAIPIYDYPGSTVLTTGVILPDPQIQEVTVSDKEIKEGTLFYLDEVSLVMEIPPFED